jgi:hypothetical protein
MGIFSLTVRHSAIMLGFAQGWLCENHCRQNPPRGSPLSPGLPALDALSYGLNALNQSSC